MESIQEWRDRCARAMGWATHSRNTAYYTMTGDPDTLNFNATNTFAKDKWKPDTDFNQAMMMRDKCKALDLADEYTSALMSVIVDDCNATGVTMDRHNHVTTFLAFASAKQISDAALRVLEGERE